MSDRHSALSFVTDRTIGTKIAAGFTVVLLFLAVSSGIAYVAFGRVASAVDTYAGLVTRSATYRDIDLKMAQYRGHVREYFYSDDQETASTVIKEGEALRKLIADGLAATSNPERQRQLRDAAKQADLYAVGFEHMHAMNLEQAKLQTGVLDVVGPQMTDAFTTVITGAVKAGNAELQRLAANGRQLSLTAQLNVNKRLGQHDEAAGKAAEQQFADVTQVLAQLDAATQTRS
jgi:CHASE3 domain sensor protein